MAKGIFVVHYAEQGKRIRSEEEVVFEFKTFVSEKAAKVFMFKLKKRYPKAWMHLSTTMVYTVECQPESDYV